MSDWKADAVSKSLFSVKLVLLRSYGLFERNFNKISFALTFNLFPYFYILSRKYFEVHRIMNDSQRFQVTTKVVQKFRKMKNKT